MFFTKYPNLTCVPETEKIIIKNDIFLLAMSSVQYKSADKITDSNPKVTFNINRIITQYVEEVTLNNDGTFSLNISGKIFGFKNVSSGLYDDFEITRQCILDGDCCSGVCINNTCKTSFDNP